MKIWGHFGLCLRVMMPPLRLAGMLLSGLILLSLVTTVTCSSLDGYYFTEKELDFETRNKIESGLNTAKEVVSVVTETITRKQNLETVTGLMKGLSNFANVVPFIGPAFAIINLAMLFVPQHDPVLREVMAGFTEVNRKLDSLATDVEWFNYASVYSQDEMRILSAWKKYEEFFRKQNINEKNYLAKVFVNYYEYSQVESSVDSLYHYLSVEGTSLSGNLNKLLQKKFKCDLKKILNYNMYFNSLLVKGIALNNFYWNLIGYKTTYRQAEHNNKFKDIVAVQLKVTDYCVKHRMNYVKDDVVEVAKSVGYDNLQGIADKVKGFLDDKYDLYKWVVFAYKNSRVTGSFPNEHLQVFDTMTKISLDNYHTVAVAYTEKAHIPEEHLKKLQEAYSCLQPIQPNRDVTIEVGRYDEVPSEAWIPQDQTRRVTYEERTLYTRLAYVVVGFADSLSPGTTSSKPCASNYLNVIYYSRPNSACDGPDAKCQNDGTCKRLLDSNNARCECKDGFYGDSCQKRGDNIKMFLDLTLPLSTVKPTSVRLADIESKLKEISDKIQC